MKILICLFFIISTNSFAARPYAEIIIDANNGKIIHELNSQILCHPASLTKLMTIYLTFEKLSKGELRFKQKLPISEKAIKQPASKLYFKKNQEITVENAILALIVKSANDVAVILSEALAENEWHFTHMMNKKARKIGMYNTHFRNASGLHHGDQFSNAKDMAKLALAIKNDFPQYFYLFKETSFKYGDTTYQSHNYVLRDFLPATGMKTGYTDKSGYNLISTAKLDGKEILGVIIGANSARKRNDRMIILLKEILQGKKYSNLNKIIPYRKPKRDYINKKLNIEISN